MPGYYESRLAAILARATPADTPKPPREHDARGRVIVPRFTVFLDNEAYNWLQRKAPRGWRTKYLNALLMLNPTLDCWQDTRPEHLRAADFDRLAIGHRPLWTDGTEPIAHHLDIILKPDAQAIVEMVSDSYGIGPQQYAALHRWEGIVSTKLDKELSPMRKVTGVLRAIGGGYLTPRFEPHLTYEPKVPRYGKLKKGAKSS